MPVESNQGKSAVSPAWDATQKHNATIGAHALRPNDRSIRWLKIATIRYLLGFLYDDRELLADELVLIKFPAPLARNTASA